MYFDDASGREIACPDPRAGLYIKARSGALVKAAIPPDCCAFQCGETLQIASGGVLRATPHCVRAAENAPGVARATLAVFMEPEPLARMAAPLGTDAAALLAGAEHLPRGVPPLGSRWAEGDSFADFTEKTLKSYY
jgi:isopenicillin N synthase-like dioxygenase